jgi:hypothetical protein
MFLTASAFAQAPPVASTEACGRQNVSFKVKLDESPHTLAQPDPGKALVYFFHDAGTNITLGYPTVKLAIDGAWVGANHGNSCFSVSVEPGERHVCVTLQSSLVAQRGTRALHRRSGKSLLLPHTTRYVAKCGVVRARSPRQRSRQVSDHLFPPKRFNSQEVNVMQEKREAAQTSGGLLFVAMECVRYTHPLRSQFRF